MQDSRRLVIVRHAKAEAQGPTDHERRLADRGRADARAGGAWLAATGIRPDLALVSSARRALETYDALSEGAGWELEAEASETLYSAEPETARRWIESGVQMVACSSDLGMIRRQSALLLDPIADLIEPR